MFSIPLTIETLKAVITLLVLAAAVYSFVREKISPDLTALLAIIALLITGVLKPDEAFSGFSHPATISVAAVLVLSAAIERTGALNFLARRVLAPLGQSEWLLTAVLMLLIGALSAFINNTAAVAGFFPLVIETRRRTGGSPGGGLMPRSHAGTFGGLWTLVGTSTNLGAPQNTRRQGVSGVSMFELGKVGLPVMIAGFVYMLFIGRWFLPRTQATEPLLSNEEYLAELLVQPRAPWIGREVSASSFQRDFDVQLVGLRRGGQLISVHKPGTQYVAGDSLRVRGTLEQVLALAEKEGLELHRPRKSGGESSSETAREQGSVDATAEVETPNKTTAAKKLPLAEVVVLITSGLIGQTLKQARFAERFDVVVLAVRRRGKFRERPSTTPLRAGDVLLIEATEEAIKQLADTRGFLVIGTPSHPEQRPGKLLITLLTLIAVITVAAFGWAPIVTTATAGCAVLMLTGCLRPREAYQAIDLSLVFLLAGSLALGLALEKTGVTALFAKGLAGLTGITGPYLILASFFIVAMVISELMSNSGTVALLAPMAISTAAQMEINPMPLLVAVTFGSSAAFALPIGYQTSLMIYGPGGYQFRDFLRMGIALDLIVAILALWLIPLYWPLQ